LVCTIVATLIATTIIGGLNVPSYNLWDICVEAVTRWFDCTLIRVNPMCWCCFCIDVSRYICKFWYLDVTLTNIVCNYLFSSLKWANFACTATNCNKQITILSQLVNHHILHLDFQSYHPKWSKITKNLLWTFHAQVIWWLARYLSCN